MGSGKTLTPAGSVNDGNGGNNYAVSVVTSTSGSVTPLAITVTAATSTKGYDGTTTAAATPRSPAAAWPRRHGGLQRDVQQRRTWAAARRSRAAGSVNDGNGGNDYTVTVVTSTSGSIRPRAITVTAATSTKGYDGTTTAAAAPTITGGSLATGDTAAFSETFDNRNAGSGKTLTPAGSVNDGNGGNNYTVTFATSASGSITPAADHRHGGHQQQGLRRHDDLGGRADDHRRHAGHRRHGGLQRDVRQRRTWAAARRSRRPARSTTATAATTTR